MWNFNQYNNRIAVIEKDAVYSYAELNNMQEEIASYIRRRAIIFIICSNSVESLVGYIGSIQNRAIPFLLSSKLSCEKYSMLVETYKPRYIWCETNRDIKCFSSNFKLHFSANINEVYKLNNYILYELAYEEAELNEIPNEELALLLSTSGSTGSSKLVKISYDNLKSNTEAIVEALGITSEDVTITTLPMNYTYGLSIINTYLYAGATIVLNEDSVMSKSFWDKMEKHKVTSISGVPYTYDMLKKLKIDRKILPHLRVLTQAGGGMSVDTRRYLQDYCERCDKKLVVMYGQTEATARISYMPYEKLHKKPDSVGVAIPGGKIWIQNEQAGECVAPYVEGEIIYEGKNVSQGYAYTREDLSKGAERSGILHTGDYGYLDEEGFLYIVGRKDRQVKLFGNRIDLSSIERDISNKYGGQCICGALNNKFVIRHTLKGKESDICNYVSGMLNLHVRNISYEYIEGLHRSEAGKVFYALVQ